MRVVVWRHLGQEVARIIHHAAVKELLRTMTLSGSEYRVAG